MNETPYISLLVACSEIKTPLTGSQIKALIQKHLGGKRVSCLADDKYHTAYKTAKKLFEDKHSRAEVNKILMERFSYSLGWVNVLTTRVMNEIYQEAIKKNEKCRKQGAL